MFSKVLQKVPLVCGVVLILSFSISGIRAQEIAEVKQELDTLRRQLVFIRTEFQNTEQDRNAVVGRVERIEFQLRKLSGRLDDLVTSLDARLAELEAGLQKNPPSDKKTSVLPSQPPETLTLNDQSLGEIKVDQEGKPIGGGSINQNKSIAARYTSALNLLKQKQHAQARLALRELLKESPDDPLASNMQYWIGETYYAQNQFERAVSQYARSALRYPEGVKILDSLLKLGLSLGNLGRVKDACRTLQQMKEHPAKAGQELVLAREDAWQKYGCGENS